MVARSLVFLLTILLSISCSHTNKKYKKQNDLDELKIDSDESKFISFKDIPKFERRKYMVSPGYKFSISHPSDEKLKGVYRVSYDGILRLPYNVRIKADGLTFNQLREKVRASYRKFFQAGVDKVSLSLISKMYYVEVRGFVNKPGRYLITRKQSIDSIIDKAGGLKGSLKTDFISAAVNQRGKPYTISLNQYYENINYRKAFTWTGGDTIFINLMNDASFEASVPMISMIGGVAKPGKVLFKKNKDLFYYISKSGGLQSSINLAKGYIVRTADSGLEKIEFDVTNMEELPALQANDVILLSTRQETSWDKFLQRTSQITGILASIALLIIAF